MLQIKHKYNTGDLNFPTIFSNPHQICPGTLATHLAHSFLRLTMNMLMSSEEWDQMRLWDQLNKTNFKLRYHKM